MFSFQSRIKKRFRWRFVKFLWGDLLLISHVNIRIAMFSNHDSLRRGFQTLYSGKIVEGCEIWNSCRCCLSFGHHWNCLTYTCRFCHFNQNCWGIFSIKFLGSKRLYFAHFKYELIDLFVVCVFCYLFVMGAKNVFNVTFELNFAKSTK